jgi:hypothetical protein
VSVKYRWVGIHEQVLNVPIVCRDMSPVSLVVSYQQKLDFFPTALLAVVREKLTTDPRIERPACCGLCRERFFSGAVDLFKYVDDCIKDCHVRGPSAGSVRVLT